MWLVCDFSSSCCRSDWEPCSWCCFPGHFHSTAIDTALQCIIGAISTTRRTLPNTDAPQQQQQQRSWATLHQRPVSIILNSVFHQMFHTYRAQGRRICGSNRPGKLQQIELRWAQSWSCQGAASRRVDSTEHSLLIRQKQICEARRWRATWGMCLHPLFLIWIVASVTDGDKGERVGVRAQETISISQFGCHVTLWLNL